MAGLKLQCPVEMVRIRNLSGMFSHLFAGILVFTVWRIFGMPFPATLGRLIPLAWITGGLLYGKGTIPRTTLPLLAIFLLTALFWRTAEGMEVVITSTALIGLFPGLIAISKKRLGILRAIIPILPLLILIVPFSGDEPHHATITEQMVNPGEGKFGNLTYQIGDPSSEINHHMKYYPALMIPGYWMGVPGVRLMNILFALFAAFLLEKLLRKRGYEHSAFIAFLGLILFPGVGVLGLVYPGWLVIALFLFALMKSDEKYGLLRIFLIALVITAVKFRFAAFGLGLIAARFLETPGRKKYKILLVTIAGIALILALDIFLFDGRFAMVRYGNSEFLKTIVANLYFRLHTIAFALVSSILDIEGGLFFRAPWIILAFAGLPALKKEHPRLFLYLGIPTLFYVLTLLVWVPTDWHGLPTPVGRMMLPVLPLFLASAGMLLRTRGAKLLIWLSILISVLNIVHPVLRFNDADGTDVMITELTGINSNITQYLPSMIRPDPLIYGAWILIFALLVYVVAKKKSGIPYILLAIVVFLGAASEWDKSVWEAEDIPTEYRPHCILYGKRDPLNRKFWIFSLERMLYLSGSDDIVTLPLKDSDADSITVSIDYIPFARKGAENTPGISLSCGGKTVYVIEPAVPYDSPDWLKFISGGRREFEYAPEFVRKVSINVTLPRSGTCDSLVIMTTEIPDNYFGEGIYLDRIEIH